MKRVIVLICMILILGMLTGCDTQNLQPPNADGQPTTTVAAEITEPTAEITPTPIVWQVNSEGETLKERIPVPEGFSRIDCEPDSFGEFLRGQKLEPDGSPVKLYDGREKANQNVHIAVLAIDVGERDRQQCADAGLRLRAEYLYSIGEYDKISYHLTNGVLFPYSQYRAGYRLKVDGNDTSLVKSADENTSYERFRKYLDLLFAYAGTISVSKESTTIEKDDMQIGDIFVIGGSPGHCVMVVDMCENKDTGEKAFLIAQSYMPAQQIHVLKNIEQNDPWYRLSALSYPFRTPEWTFDEECLKRMP